MWTTEKLRKTFLDFFKERGHQVVPSSSVVPNNDPTLLFTNSGMVQFKGDLLGEKNSLKRACSVQRCIRAGGKHNDLDDVGKDNYHHTFFEMLGNWSFGDYFKEEAIDYAWEFLVGTLLLDPSRLYVTYYDELDKDSLKYWKKYLPPSRIISSSYKDNFWEMGETGPCGPCTEIHYDRIGGRDASTLVNKDDPNVLEIWNIVFIEFNRNTNGLVPLDKQCIDTGIGLERLLSILLDVPSNYKIDTFSTLLQFVESHCSFRYYDGLSNTDVAFRVVVDHCRTIAVCLNDRVEFSNEGQGYVLRRILRRAVRYSCDVLQMERGCLSRVVREAFVCLGLPPTSLDSVDKEECLFLSTLQKGVERFFRMTKDTKVLSGVDLFTLYDTFGFPVDLTEILARENNIKIDYKGYEECVRRGKEISRKPSTRIPEIIVQFPKTEDNFKYNSNGISSTIQFYVLGKQIFTLFDKIPKGIEVGLVFMHSCFYAECGGQIGDTGEIIFEGGEKFKVEDVQNVSGYVVHYGVFELGDSSDSNGDRNNEDKNRYYKGDSDDFSLTTTKAILNYNSTLRMDTACNHTATHLLLHLLNEFKPTEQRGSLVTPLKTRLDFEGTKLELSILKDLEDRFNKLVREGHPVTSSIQEKELVDFERVVHLKGETYPPRVRVITITGVEAKDLCGGTHIDNLSAIGKFKILSEGSISSNVRRIVAITGREVERVEKEISKIKNRLLKGEIVSIDKNLPLFDKLELERIKKENLHKSTILNKEMHKKNKDAFMLRELNAPFEYSTTSTMTVKEIIKNIESLLPNLSSGLIYFFKDDFLYFFIPHRNNLHFDSSIHSRVKGGYVYGTIRVEGSREETFNKIKQ